MKDSLDVLQRPSQHFHLNFSFAFNPGVSLCEAYGHLIGCPNVDYREPTGLDVKQETRVRSKTNKKREETGNKSGKLMSRTR